MDPIEGAVFVKGDMNLDSTRENILHAIDGSEVDVVLSDMSPSTTGEKETNHVRIMQLADEALSFAESVLRNGGTFCCKIFSGREEVDFRAHLRTHFVNVKGFKPLSSRKLSPETYYIARGYVPQHLRPTSSGTEVELLADLEPSGTVKSSDAQ